MRIERGETVVTLRNHQIEHFVRLATIMASNHCAFDVSPLRSGKSFTAAALAIHFGFQNVLVICPKTVKVSWDDVVQRTNIPVVATITYQTLRGMTGHAISHPYLTRHDRPGETTIFAPTDAFRALLQAGVLLVFDEVQNIKNNSDQMKAAKSMISLLLSTTTGNSRAMFLSGSPFDKEEHAVNFMRCLSFIRHRNLYTYHRETAECRLQGAGELIEVCQHFDADVTNQIVGETDLNKKTIAPMCYRLFCEVLKVHLMSSMTPPKLDVEKDIKNGYYHLDNPTPLMEAIGFLGRAARFHGDTGTYDAQQADWGSITLALMALETAKIPIYVRLARKRLTENTTNQVIIALNYTSSLLEIAELLREFHPMILNGSTTDKGRATAIQSFQAGTGRLLVMNMKVGGVGISLHDLLGGRKRYTYGSPNYMAIDMHQCSGRTHCDGALTPSEIRWVYGSCNMEETGILNALARKRAVLEKILDKQVDAGVKFPGSYETENYTLENE